MADKKTIIFGTGKMARLAYFHFTKDSPVKIAAFTVDSRFIDIKNVWNLPLVPFEDVEKIYPPDKYNMFIATGYKGLNGLRAEKYKEAKDKGYELISYICSKATHWGDTETGDNCFISENVVIQPFVKIGNNVVIRSGAFIGHDTVIQDHCWISAHCVISSSVTIESYCFTGVNVTVRDRVKLSKKSLVGAGSVILNDTKVEGVYIAKPAELYRLNSEQFIKMMDI